MKKRKNVKRNKNFVSVFKETILEATAREMKKIAERYRDMVKEVIEKQLYKWKPLSKEYLEYKKNQGLDTRILIATGEYVESIEVIREVSRKDGVSYSVGVRGSHSSNGIDLVLLARYLEFGTSKMPMRQHFRPTWAILLSKLPITSKKVNGEIIRSLKRNLK